MQATQNLKKWKLKIINKLDATYYTSNNLNYFLIKMSNISNGFVNLQPY